MELHVEIYSVMQNMEQPYGLESIIFCYKLIFLDVICMMLSLDWI